MNREELLELVPNEMLYAYIARVPDLSLSPPLREVLREGLATEQPTVDALIDRALGMRSPGGYLVRSLEGIQKHGWPTMTGPGASADEKTRNRMTHLATSLRRSESWTGMFHRDAQGRESWRDEEAEWAAYIRLECEDAGVPSVADDVIRAARAAVPTLAKVSPAGSSSVTRYAEPAR